jgi:hypothetical protein
MSRNSLPLAQARQARSCRLEARRRGDREHHDVRLAHRVRVVARERDAQRLRRCLEPRAGRLAEQDVVGADDGPSLPGHQPAADRLAGLAEADEGDATRSFRMQRRVLAGRRVGDRLFERGLLAPLLGRAHAAVAADLVEAPEELEEVVVRDRGTRPPSGSRRGGGPRSRSSRRACFRWSRARRSSSSVANSKARWCISFAAGVVLHAAHQREAMVVGVAAQEHHAARHHGLRDRRRRRETRARRCRRRPSVAGPSPAAPRGRACARRRAGPRAAPGGAAPALAGSSVLPGRRRRAA